MPISVFPRYIAMQCEAGIKAFNMAYESPQETQSVFPTSDGKFTPTGHFQVDCAKCTFITDYTNNTQVSSTGSLRCQFRRFSLPSPPNTSSARPPPFGKAPVVLKLEYVEMHLQSHQHFVLRPSKFLSAPRKQPSKEPVQKPAEPEDFAHFMVESPDALQTSPQGKIEDANPEGLKTSQSAQPEPSFVLPSIKAGPFGIPSSVLEFLEVN